MFIKSSAVTNRSRQMISWVEAIKLQKEQQMQDLQQVQQQ